MNFEQPNQEEGNKDEMILKEIREVNLDSLNNLGSLEKLDDETAEFLVSNFKGPFVLNGLKQISDSVADILSKGQTDVILLGLESISDSALKSLSRVVESGDHVLSINDSILDKSGLTDVVKKIKEANKKIFDATQAY